MGVKGLWPFIETIGDDDTLFDIGGRSIWSNDERYTVGVDALGWCYEAQETVQQWARGGNRKSAGLFILFERIAHLAGLPIAVTFVQDGPARPGQKRGRKVVMADHSLLKGMREIAEAFGFDWHKAPGEAEAELAMLNFEGAIDAVLSEDNDVFIFGAQTALRKSKKEKHSDHERWPVRVYTANELETSLPGSVSLTREALLLIAILVGGDYDTKGLPRCGVQTAALLSSSILNHAQTLYDAVTAHQYNLDELKSALTGWRLKLADELELNPCRTLPERHPALADTLRNMSNFPNAQTAINYVFPVVSSRASAIRPARARINIAKLTQVCEHYFSFSTSPDAILSKLFNIASPAFVMDGLLGEFADHRSVRAAVQPTLVMRRQGINEKDVYEFRCAVPTEHILTAIASSFLGTRAPKADSNSSRKEAEIPSEFRAWVSQSILFKVVPELVRQYRKHSKRTGKVASVRPSKTSKMLANDVPTEASHALRVEAINVKKMDLKVDWEVDKDGTVIIND